MTSTEVLSPPPPAAVPLAADASQLKLDALNLPMGSAHVLGGAVELSNTQIGDVATFARSSFRNEAVKAGALGIAGMLDMKAEALEVVVLDNWSAQPVDRGPAPAAPDPRLLRSWQYQVTGKLAAAQVVADLKAEHIKSGGPAGIQAVAEKYIVEHGKSDDSFYLVDLGNVNRMLRACPA